MKDKSILTLLGTVFGLVLLLAGVQMFAAGQGNEKPERSIEGTWRTTVTPVNCQTGVPVAPAFPGLLGFNKGNTLAGTSTVAASAFGVWRREGGWENYSFAFTNFRYNTSGVFIGTQTVRQTVKLGASGDEFASTGTVEIFDTSGNQIGTGCAVSTGTRFQ
jgi:hypothetical protein